jgi:hypothetical protein
VRWRWRYIATGAEMKSMSKKLRQTKTPYAVTALADITDRSLHLAAA